MTIPNQTSEFLEAIVPIEYNGYRLDQVLAKLFANYSRTYLQKKVSQGYVQINHQLIQEAKYKVFADQHIQMTITESKQTSKNWTPEVLPLTIIYEDETLLVINKPAGIVVHPAPGNLNGTLVNALLNHYPSLEKLPRAGIIHRLDRDTSGLLIVPKTLTAYTCLANALATRKIERHYQAIVQGVLITGGTINAPIGRHPILRKKQAIAPIHGKPAITHYQIIERFSYHTLLGVKLETGRTHQIRVHMHHLQHAVLGDPVYGARMKTFSTSSKEPIQIELKQAIHQFRRQALHAYALKVQHPLTNQFMRWIAPLPSDMKHLLFLLRNEYQIQD